MKTRANKPTADITNAFYVDHLMDDWGLRGKSKTLQACVRQVLAELETETLLFLQRHPKLEVMAVKERCHYNVWAYFPVHRGRWIAKKLKPKPTTRVLLVLCEPDFDDPSPWLKRTEALEALAGHIRDHLGHALLYLRNPKARNECADAYREWLANCQPRARRKAIQYRYDTSEKGRLRRRRYNSNPKGRARDHRRYMSDEYREWNKWRMLSLRRQLRIQENKI